jgi:hypothetical protein
LEFIKKKNNYLIFKLWLKKNSKGLNHTSTLGPLVTLTMGKLP